MPALKIIRRIRIDIALQLSAVISLLPDHALQCFERPFFAILGYPGLEDINQALHIFTVDTTFFCDQSQLFSHSRRGVMVRADKFRQVFTGVGKQHIVHE